MKDFMQPVLATKPRPDPSNRERTLYLRSYLFMRATVGAIGIVLPVLLLLVDGLWFGEDVPRDSLSAYYYSGARELFVGTLCATAVFLITYKVFERNLDNTLSIVAGAAALAVALFPTGRPSSAIALTPLQVELSEGFVRTAHFVGAGIFILSLGAICFTFGVREGKRPPRPGQRRSPQFWRRYHWTCSGIIGVAVLFILVADPGFGWETALFIGETVSVWAFGASWLMKGLELPVLRRQP